MSHKPFRDNQDASDVTSEVRVRTIPSKTITRTTEEQQVAEIVITNRRTGKRIVNEVPLLADILLD